MSTRMLGGPLAKKPLYATAQYSCPTCGKELTLLGETKHEASLHHPKCDTTVMKRVHYAATNGTPTEAMLAKLRDSKKKWVTVNVVNGNPAAHRVRDAGRSPLLDRSGDAHPADAFIGDTDILWSDLFTPSPDIVDPPLSRRQVEDALNGTTQTNRGSTVQTDSRGFRTVDRTGRGDARDALQLRPLKEGETLAELISEGLKTGGRRLRRGRD